MTDSYDRIETALDEGEERAGQTEKTVDAMLAAVQKTVSNNPREVIEVCKKAYALSQKLSYERGQGNSLALLGYAQYLLSEFDEALSTLLRALPLVQAAGELRYEAHVMEGLAHVYLSMGNHEQNLYYILKNLQKVREIGDRLMEAWCLHETGVAYYEAGDNDTSLTYQNDSLRLFRELRKESTDPELIGGEARALTGIGTVYQAQGRDREALACHEEALQLFREAGNLIGESRALNDLGRIFQRLGELDKAVDYHRESLRIREQLGNRQSQTTSLIDLGTAFIRQGRLDEALDVLKRALEIAELIGARPRVFQAHAALSEAYELKGDLGLALHHFRMFHKIKEEVLGEQAQARLKHMQVSFDVEQAQREAAIAQSKNAELERVIGELRATQAQLIQSEKMASLGKLTAGIAHEIKNPLNFVNNFAALSAEYAEELAQVISEADSRPVNEITQDLMELVSGIRFNAEKITEHGKRADNIVKGMLLHSRGRPGEVRPVPLNELVDEYANLAYHGMRAQIQDFNVTIEKDLDERVGLVDVVPQDIGRVLINLFNNAFYAVRERSLAETLPYVPTVLVSTHVRDGHVEIRVKDNGTGIPEELHERIFEPFFTTKPTGSGTGLGLSIAYEIVTQGHRGNLRFESVPGEYTEFIVELPLSGSQAAE
jgi:two-component system NtrC family sensor kinase